MTYLANLGRYRLGDLNFIVDLDILSDDQIKAGEQEQQQREWQAIETMRDAFRPAVANVVSQWFDEMEKAILPEIKAEAKMIDFSGIFDFNKWRRLFIDLLTGNIRRIIEEGMIAGMLRAGLGQLTQEQLDSRNVQLDIIEKQVIRSELVTKNTQDDLIGLLIDMVQDNATQDEMQIAMRRKFEGYRNYRVDRITNTVVVGAFEAGTLLSWQEAGITKKGWLSTQDGRVRETHDAANGQQVDISDVFTVGTAALKHPGDPDGPPGEIINCRCTLLPIIED